MPCANDITIILLCRIPSHLSRIFIINLFLEPLEYFVEPPLDSLYAPPHLLCPLVILSSDYILYHLVDLSPTLLYFMHALLQALRLSINALEYLVKF